MVQRFTPLDESARIRIRESVDETLFVEAGAGTGKTTSLVDRIKTLIASGITTVDRIAAITFTESAASELRDRIRERLEQSADDPAQTEVERSLCRQGVSDLDSASFQTLHGFAAALLQERPLEAGLPPSFETMDEIAGELAFDEAWAEWIDWALDDAANIPTLPLALSLGLRPDDLRSVALKFHQNHDLLTNAAFDDVSMPSPLAVPGLVGAAGELSRLCGLSKIRESDALFDHVQSKLASIPRFVGMEAGSASAYRLLNRLLPLRQSGGAQRNWETDPVSGENACTYLKDLMRDLDSAANEEIAQVRQAALVPLLRALRGFVLQYALDRRRQGRAGYHDLLVWARDLLRDNIGVRDHFRSKFTHLLIDEAQDTDPIQAEIAMFLAERVDPVGLDSARPRRWEHVTPDPGKLFVVGDPKQSIYRFRRADVQQMALLQQRIGGEAVRLVQNFRSQRPVIDWVNHVFGLWMASGNTGVEYGPLVHRWEVETDHFNKPSVWCLGAPMEGNIGPVREFEADGIVELLARIVGDGWQLRDEDSDDESAYRPARFSDICILMPRRTALPQLELALDDADIPYRLEGASLIYVTQEVRDVLNCLKAIDDPADEVAIVAALRSPAFACTDVELLQFYESGGRFDYLSDVDSTQGPVAGALGELRSYHHRRLWAQTSDLIDRFIRERPLMTSAVEHPRTREQWRRYRFVVDQARAFSRAGGNSLRAFLEWVEVQAAERARVTEVAVPETDEEAVRVMTVHGSKGLEFPVVVLTGLNSGGAQGPGSVLFDREGRVVEASVGLSGRRFETPGYQALAANEQAMLNAEAIRLLYVATTRAKDHLVLSLYRTGSGRSDAATIAAHLDGHDHLWRQILPDAEDAENPTHERPVSVPLVDASDTLMVAGDPAAGAQDSEHSLEARGRWIHDRDLVMAQQGRPSSVAATRLAQIANEEAKEEPESEEPWKRGRAGTSVGRAVHAVLQTIDLATGSGIDETARAQSAAEGIPQRYAEVARLARIAVDSDAVRRAVASGRLWREVPVGIPLDDGVLEGFIDLLFETDDGLVVVDYKTDSLTAEQAADAAQRYSPQAGGYALAIQRVTGRPVNEVIFLFLQPHVEVVLTHIPELAAQAEALADSFLRVQQQTTSAPG